MVDVAPKKPGLPWSKLSAELVVIVLGVLLALAADAWMEGRREQELEAEYIEALLRDVEVDIASVDAMTTSFNRRIQGQTELVRLIRSRDVISDSVRFLSRLAFASNYGTFDARTSAFEDLVDTGRLHLIRDPALREHLIRYYNEVENTAELDNAHRSAVVSAFLMYLPPAIGGFGLAMAYQDLSFMGHEYEPNNPELVRAEATLALGPQEVDPEEYIRRFVVVAGRLMGKSRNNFSTLGRLARELRDELRAAQCIR